MMRKNHIYDSSPTDMYRSEGPEQLMNLRPRQQDKEIGEQFRFKAKTSVERICDKL